MNDIDEWADLESMDKRTKEYRKQFKSYVERYIEVK